MELRMSSRNGNSFCPTSQFVSSMIVGAIDPDDVALDGMHRSPAPVGPLLAHPLQLGAPAAAAHVVPVAAQVEDRLVAH